MVIGAARTVTNDVPARMTARMDLISQRIIAREIVGEENSTKASESECDER